MPQKTAPQKQAPGGPQVQIRNLFPTPIAVFSVPNAEKINDALEAKIFVGVAGNRQPTSRIGAAMRARKS